MLISSMNKCYVLFMRRASWIVAFLIVCLSGWCFCQSGGQAASPKVQEELLIERAEKGDGQARAQVVRQAQQGNPQAENAMGVNYQYGIWSPKDAAEALRWYRKAAQDGNTDARQTLGQKYFEGDGVKQDYAEAARWFGCPKPSESILGSCKAISYVDLPRGARTFLAGMKCEAGSDSDYDYGSAVDLAGNGAPAYEICCHEHSHGPCGAVVIGRIGGQWKELSPKEGVLGFDGACNGFIVLDNQHKGFHDVCLPSECAAPAKENMCPGPAIWQFGDQGRYGLSTAASQPK